MYLECSIIICIFLQHMDLVSEINVYIIYIKSVQQILLKKITFGHTKRHSKKNQKYWLDVGIE